MPADVVEHVVARRATSQRQESQTDAAVRGDGKLQFLEFAPDRIVVVKAVEAVIVEISGGGKCRWIERRDRTCDAGRNHCYFEAVGMRKFQLLDRFLRCMHRDRGSRREAVAKRT